MKPATEDLLNKIREDYEKFKKLGHSDLKAAYLATSGRGFIEIKSSIKDSILLLRPEDGFFIVMSSPERTVKRFVPVRERSANFHTNKDIFNT